jgi:hypothetical protein
MAMTNAERQARYKEKLKAQGRKRQDEWITEGGGLAEADKQHVFTGTWPTMTKEQLDEAIKKAVSIFTEEDEFMKDVVYAEIAAYAKKAAARYERYNTRAKKEFERVPKAL